MFDRRLVTCFDWGLLLIVLTICAAGLVVLYSATAASLPPGEVAAIFKKQMIWMVGGLGVMAGIFPFHYRSIDKAGGGIYLACIGLLIAVLLVGKHVGGSQRWLSLGPFTVQPSELMKLSLIIALSSVYSHRVTEEGLGFYDLIKPAVVVALPFALIVIQPDLGTALLLLFIAVSMTLFVNVRKKVLIFCAGAGVAMAPLVWFVLKDYQKARILTFLNPERDPLGAGYHIIQSKIAIGSGMLLGKGYLKGTQNALSFLPEQHTDFILSVLAEEWGFAGCLSLLCLYFFFLVWGFNIAYGCRDMFGSILAFGITIMVFWQIFINIGMVMGLMPVVGVPLPLISYGGSSVITNMAGIGLLMNISMRRYLSG